MRCGYCYYLGKAALSPTDTGVCPRTCWSATSSNAWRPLQVPPTTHFEWHGGEPTLLGLDYFRFIVSVQRSHRPPGRKVTNGIQTNGLLLDEAWGEFLKEEGFFRRVEHGRPGGPP